MPPGWFFRILLEEPAGGGILGNEAYLNPQRIWQTLAEMPPNPDGTSNRRHLAGAVCLCFRERCGRGTLASFGALVLSILGCVDITRGNAYVENARTRFVKKCESYCVYTKWSLLSVLCMCPSG